MVLLDGYEMSAPSCMQDRPGTSLICGVREEAGRAGIMAFDYGTR